MSWWSERHTRRFKRQLRQQAYVHCEGDVASFYPYGDADVCFKDGCDWPDGGPCLALVQEEERYRQLVELHL